MSKEQFEQIFRKNFNEMMPGVKFKKITYEQFCKEYPTLKMVIMRSMFDAVKANEPAPLKFTGFNVGKKNV